MGKTDKVNTYHQHPRLPPISSSSNKLTAHHRSSPNAHRIPAGTITAFVAPGFRAHSWAYASYGCGVWCGFWERRGHHAMLRCLEWIGFLAVPVRESFHSCSRRSPLLLLLGCEVVGRNCDWYPCGNEQRTIRLVLVVGGTRAVGIRSRVFVATLDLCLATPYGGLGWL